jgi:three-Cys-motif partner protein
VNLDTPRCRPLGNAGIARPAHRFGNASTDLKLEVIAAYLERFTTALRNQFPNLIYIDVFSGSGAREVLHEALPANLVEPAREEWIEERRGSARLALENEPPFSRLIFIENKKAFCRALRELADAYPERRVDILRGDANSQVLEAIKQLRWAGTRGVMFIDPYGMQLKWETLKAISQTRSVDVWYLVTLQGLYRQATKNRKDITPKKRAALNRMLGTDDWERAWYTPKPIGTLFDHIVDTPAIGNIRVADVDEMETFVLARLKTVFPYVSPEPLRLKTKGGAPGFALFFACSNPNPRAFGLAARIADHILKTGKSSQVRPR